MFKNLAADVLGLSDLGKIIFQKDFDKTDVDDYIFHEDNEKIYVVIKSKTDEYCFTNLAFIHLDGTSAMSKKRTLRRYSYKQHRISSVYIETAGTVDLDAELKFSVGNTDLSIDIDKKQMEYIHSIYKALHAISDRSFAIEKEMEVFNSTLTASTGIFNLRELSEQVVLNLPDLIIQTSQQVEEYTNNRKKEIRNYDFADIFDKYIKW